MRILRVLKVCCLMAGLFTASVAVAQSEYVEDSPAAPYGSSAHAPVATEPHEMRPSGGPGHWEEGAQHGRLESGPGSHLQIRPHRLGRIGLAEMVILLFSSCIFVAVNMIVPAVAGGYLAKDKERSVPLWVLACLIPLLNVWVLIYLAGLTSPRITRELTEIQDALRAMQTKQH